MEILEKVNDFFNKVSYTTDKDNYGVTDYWATPFEFLARDEGDCEDYAIAKYFLLKHLGIPSNKMYITYVGVVGYEQSHMVLTFFDTPSSEPFILDSFNEDLLLASQRKDLKPIYYFNPDVLIDGNKTSAHRKWDQLIKNIMENKI
jgi:predicted transglutaminase-like cysteine proteinase